MSGALEVLPPPHEDEGAPPLRLQQRNGAEAAAVQVGPRTAEGAPPPATEVEAAREDAVEVAAEEASVAEPLAAPRQSSQRANP